MLMRMNLGKDRSSAGFTLVEVIIVMILVPLIILGAYAVFDVSLRSYTITNNEVNAQEGFRLVTDYLDAEVRTAESVFIQTLDPSALPSVTSGGIIVYMKPLPDNEYALFEKNGANETMIGYPMRDFSAVFGVDTNYGILSVSMTTSLRDGQFDTAVLLENTQVVYGDGVVGGKNGLIYFRYPE